jgi:hypothetical protein
MLGGGNQNPTSSQKNKQSVDDNSQVPENDLDDDIPF